MRCLLLGLAILLFVTVPAFSQKCSEEFIRANIDTHDEKLVTSDVYLFSGAMEKPSVGVNTPELKKVDEKISHERKNGKYDAPKVERIFVAPSGDMGYAYGTEHMSFDEVPTNKHVDFTAAFLKVWRVAEGSCKVAAAMYEPEGEK
jgi:hypothetical protein